MFFGNKDDNGNMAVNMKSASEIGKIPPNCGIMLSLAPDNFEIRARFSREEPITLAYEKITAIKLVTEEEIKQQGKSVMGRAVVGGVLLGPLGAIVGGISGTGSKKQVIIRAFLVINYKKGDDEIGVLSFEKVDASLGLSKFYQALKSHPKIHETTISNEL